MQCEYEQCHNSENGVYISYAFTLYHHYHRRSHFIDANDATTSYVIYAICILNEQSNLLKMVILKVHWGTNISGILPKIEPFSSFAINTCCNIVIMAMKQMKVNVCYCIWNLITNVLRGRSISEHTHIDMHMHRTLSHQRLLFAFCDAWKGFIKRKLTWNFHFGQKNQIVEAERMEKCTTNNSEQSIEEKTQPTQPIIWMDN